MKNIFLLLLFVLATLSQKSFAQFTDNQKQYLESDNLLINSGAEQGLKGWTNTGCTLSLESAIVIRGSKSFKEVCSSQSLSLSQGSTQYATQLANGAEGTISAYVYSDNANVYLCQESAGALVASSDGTSIRNCKKHSGNSKYELLELPVVFGATSNGLRVVSLNATTGAALAITGTVYVDSAKVQLSIGKSSRSSIGPWTTFTPTSTWVSGATHTGRYRQVAENLEVQVKIALTGAPTSAVLDINVPSPFTIDTAKSVSTTQFVPRLGGGTAWDISASTGYLLSVLYNSTTTVRLVAQNSGAPITYSGVQQNVPFIFAISDEVTVEFSVPVIQFSGSAETYQKQCNGTECESVFSAKVGSTDVVSEENTDWITGDCTNATTGRATCNFKSGVFTVTPNCTAITVPGGSFQYVNVVSQSASSIVIENRRSDNSTTADAAFNLICQKQGVDYDNTRKIVGVFSELLSIPNISKPKKCKVNYAAGAIGSGCTGSPCTEYQDTCGTASPVTRSATGTYQLVFAAGTFANNTFMECSGGGTRAHSTNWNGAAQSSASGGVTYDFITNSGTGVLNDSAGHVYCEGQAP